MGGIALTDSSRRQHLRKDIILTRERAVSVALLCMLVSSIGVVGLVGHPSEDPPVPARIAQDGAAPVANIAWLPDIVSNGTWWALDASGSSDSDGIILNYTWRIIVENKSTYLYGMVEQFKFSALGLYKIFLTVRDNDFLTDDAFWAVFSIKDADDDSLPDWWEDKYWPTEIYGLSQSASGDPDSDGYTNLEEFTGLTDPTDPSSHPLSFWDRYMWTIVVVVVCAAAAVGVSVPLLLKRHRELDKKKIEYAIEIDKELSMELEGEQDEKKPEE